MTILVGILCEDGAVIASDGMASTNLGTIPFVGISNLKTHLIANEVIAACAGDDDLMTQFVHFLRLNYSALSQKHQNESSNVLALMNELGAKFAHTIVDNLKKYPAELVKTPLEEITASGFNFAAIVALPFNDKHYIFHYNHLLNATMLRNNGIWHVILGSGSYVANPSIHLVKKMLNINLKPKVDRGQILAYWTVNHAIEVSSGGIGREITIAVLQKANGQYKASLENRVSEHKAFIEDFYKHMWDYETSACQEEQIEEIPKL